MKILITGSNGQVGSSLVKLLSQMHDIEFLAVGRELLDITDNAAVSKLVNEYRPDVIINAAAYTAVDKAEQDYKVAYAVNHDGPRNLAIAAQKGGALIIHISTDYVFSGDKEGLYIEDDAVAPKSVYGLSKLAGERSVASSCSRHIILRTAWVFSEQGNNFVSTMLRLSRSLDTLGIVADQFGGPTFADDIASAIIKIAELTTKADALYGVYHYSGFPYVSWFQFSEKIFEVALQQKIIPHAMKLTAITTSDYPTVAKRPKNSKLNCEKILKNFDIKQSNWQKALLGVKAYK